MYATLGIAIVNYNSAGDVAELLRSIEANLRGAAGRTVVALVDNSDEAESLGGVARDAQAAGLDTHVLSGHGNVGYAAGNNIAARFLMQAGADVLWVLNPDTRVVGGDVAAMLALAEQGRVVAATTAADHPGPPRPDRNAIHLWTGQSGPAPDPAEAGARLTYVAGHSLVMTRAAWAGLDGLCEDFFLFFEEADLAVRCAALGIGVTWVEDVTVRHEGGGTTGATTDLSRKSATAYFHASRSCMIFFRRHFRRRLLVAGLARAFYAGKVCVTAGPRQAGAVVRGTIAGLTA